MGLDETAWASLMTVSDEAATILRCDAYGGARRAACGAQGAEDQTDLFFDRVDHNGDGAVVFDEYKQLCAQPSSSP